MSAKNKHNKKFGVQSADGSSSRQSEMQKSASRRNKLPLPLGNGYESRTDNGFSRNFDVIKTVSRGIELESMLTTQILFFDRRNRNDIIHWS